MLSFANWRPPLPLSLAWSTTWQPWRTFPTLLFGALVATNMDLQGPRVGPWESFSKVNSRYVNLLVLNIFWGDHPMVLELNGNFPSACKSSFPCCSISMPLPIIHIIFNVIWGLWSFSWLNSNSLNHYWIAIFSFKIIDLLPNLWKFPTFLLPSSKQDSSLASRQLKVSIQIGGNLFFFKFFFLLLVTWANPSTTSIGPPPS